MLEYSLIKEHHPRFNIRLRDDKSYPFLAVTVDEQWPRALVMRGRKRKGTRYFGPYAHAYAIRDTLDELLRSFPIRTCSPAKFRQHERLGRPCLLYHIEKCTGPCVGEIEEMPYRQLVNELCDFLDGDTDPIVKRLDARDARRPPTALEFEKAARVRDRLTAVRRAIERQQMVADRNEDLDVIGLADDELEASVQVFYVRKGRVVGRKGFIARQGRGPHARRAGRPHPRARCTARTRPRASRSRCSCRSSRTIWRRTRSGWRCCAARGCRSGCPSAATSGRCSETVTRNAQEEFTRHRLRRASDHNTRSRALTELQEHLGLPEAPLRIECYDMAHLQGTDYVGSMVVLEDGLPNKREYRRFKVHVPGNDDYAAMEEVLTRRLDRLPRRAASDRRRARRAGRGKFAYPPQLLVVDGGKGQLGVAERVVHELGLDDEIPVAALAKRFEEVYVPGRSEPVEIPRGSEALFMLQRIRDEAHRFANTFHGERREQADDGERARRHPRARRDAQEAAGQGAGRRQRGRSAAEPRASCEALPLAARTPVAAAVHAKFHPSTGVTRRRGEDALGAPRRLVDRRVHRGRRPRVRRADPAARRRRAGRRRGACSTSAAATGRSAGSPARSTGVELVVGVDPTWNQIAVAATRGGATGFVRAGADGLPFADGVVRRRRRLPRVRAHRRRRRGDRRGRPGARAAAGGSASSSTTRCCRRPDSGWIDDQVLDPPEQYWRIGPYLVEAVTVEEVEHGRAHPLRPPPAVAVRQRARRQRAAASSGWSSRRRRRASSPSPPSTPTAATVPAPARISAPRKLGAVSSLGGGGRDRR